VAFRNCWRPPLRIPVSSRSNGSPSHPACARELPRIVLSSGVLAVLNGFPQKSSGKSNNLFWFAQSHCLALSDSGHILCTVSQNLAE
jgi:hypothetical protein